MTHRTLAFVALLLLAGGLAACGEDEKPATPPTNDTATADGTPTEPRHIQFVDGFAAGVAKAKDDDTLLFVYVGRHHPT